MSRRKPWVMYRYAVIYAICVFGIASLVPIWTEWYFSAREASGVPATFWHMAASFVTGSKVRTIPTLVRDYYGIELMKALVAKGDCGGAKSANASFKALPVKTEAKQQADAILATCAKK